MHMEGYAYKWYLWWKRNNFTYTWNLFKNYFLIGFKESKKMLFLVNLPDYNRLETLRNSDKQRLETYLGGLKPYLQKELKLHDIPNVEEARRKVKATECKLEGIKTKGDSHYRQEKETQCGYYADTWSPGH